MRDHISSVATLLAQAALQKDIRIIIAVGGDGTSMNMNGFFKSEDSRLINLKPSGPDFQRYRSGFYQDHQLF